ncbi:MAG: hypothetical protein JWQ38_358 [Flavipsychrobacter sp.]|nr:hypothetical protein [Flavipsychrobacter sp.]
MFKNQANVAMDETSFQSHNRLDDILKSIDGLIFSIKMDTFQSISAHKAGNGNKALEYTAQEMMAKKNILFNLLPKEELYAITKKKSANTQASDMPLN